MPDRSVRKENAIVKHSGSAYISVDIAGSTSRNTMLSAGSIRACS